MTVVQRMPNASVMIRGDTPAEKYFRDVWASYIWQNPRGRRMLSVLLWEIAPHISPAGPQDPRWSDFTSTLPGFNLIWGQIG